MEKKKQLLPKQAIAYRRSHFECMHVIRTALLTAHSRQLITLEEK